MKHCDPVPACGSDTSSTPEETVAIGGGYEGQVLGATTDSYAQAGVAEDTLFSLLGLTGTTFTSLGILMRRNAQK